MEQISLNLIENAFDFLHSAAESIRTGTPRALKYSLLHLTAAVELVLKARLFKEDWPLVFRDPEKASEKALERGDFKSVDLDTALDRLDEVADVKIDEPTSKDLKALRALRNQVEHFAINVSRDQMMSLLAKGCAFIVRFCQDELAEEVEDQDDTFERIIGELRESEDFVALHRAAIEPEISEAAHLGWCPQCLQDTLVLCDGPPRCAFCGHRPAVEEIADSMTEGGRGTCAECEENACLVMVYNNDEAGWLCIACGTTADPLDECPRCEVGFIYHPDDAMCSRCWAEVMEGDD